MTMPPLPIPDWFTAAIIAAVWMVWFDWRTWRRDFRKHPRQELVNLLIICAAAWFVSRGLVLVLWGEK